MELNVKKFAQLTGVSVRTLHYYDEIGLLTPDFVNEQNGYRFYGENAFFRTQEILFYRELDFSLRDIKEILSSPNYDKKKALRAQKHLLILKKERLEHMIAAIERAEKGEFLDMKVFDTDEFDKEKEMYRNEVFERWGTADAYTEHKRKTASYQKEDWNKVGEGIHAIIAEFANIFSSGIKANDKEALALAKKLQDWITETQYSCTDDILLSLGELYVSDERFKKNIDKHGEGTAAFMREAIKAYCGQL